MNDLYRFGTPPESSATFAKVAREYRQEKERHLRVISAADLQGISFAPIEYVVPGYISEGLTLFAGKPKIGKSWAALDWALAVAYGGVAFGSIECPAGDVLYAALEDNQRRLQKRLQQLIPDRASWPRLHLTTQMHRLNDGALTEIEHWCSTVERPRLVIIDTLACIRPARTGKENSYESDYAAVGPLQHFAGENNLAIVCIHHTRKMEADDALDTVSGTTGLTGGAAYQNWFVRAPEWVKTAEDALRPEIWRKTQCLRDRSFRRFDAVRIVAYDETWMVDATVTDGDNTKVVFAPSKVLSIAPRYDQLFQDENYRVIWAGSGFTVERKKDQRAMTPVRHTQALAIADLSNLYPKVA